MASSNRQTRYRTRSTNTRQSRRGPNNDDSTDNRTRRTSQRSFVIILTNIPDIAQHSRPSRRSVRI